MRKLKFKKQYIIAILLTVTCVVVGTLCIVKAMGAKTISESEIIQLENITVTADGGHGKDVPKNTTYAVNDLTEKFFSSVKIDARLTRDNKWVCLADSDISTVTNGKGNVKEYNYYNLLNYNIKNFEQQPSPVIELTCTVANHAYSSGVLPMIYIHDNDKAAINSLVEKLSKDGTYVTHFMSSDLEILKYIETITDNASLVLYVDEITDEAISIAEKNSRYVICFDYKENNKKDIEKVIVDEISFICRGADTILQIERCYNMGVRHFITDKVKVG